MQRAWCDSFPPRSCTSLSSWGWETAPISFSPRSGLDRFGVTIASAASRSQLSSWVLHSAKQPTAVQASSLAAAVINVPVFLACLMELSLCIHSRSGARGGQRWLQDTKAAQSCCVWPHKCPCSCPWPCLPVCTHSTTPLVSPLKSSGFREVSVCRDTSQKPEDLDASQLAPLCMHGGPFHTKHTLLSGTDISSQH